MSKFKTTSKVSLKLPSKLNVGWWGARAKPSTLDTAHKHPTVWKGLRVYKCSSFHDFEHLHDGSLIRLSALLSKVLTYPQIQVRLTKLYDLDSLSVDLATKVRGSFDELYLASILWCISSILWEFSLPIYAEILFPEPFIEVTLV